ncbi:MAG: TspO/MBR family protein [Hyphomicrobium sp.]
MIKYASLIVFLALVAVAAYSGMAHLPGPFYAALQKPVWTPPDTVFAPVWAILYVMIALAGWIAWRAQGFGPLLWLWLLQLMLNAAWSYLMFGEKQIFHALVDISALWLVVLAFIVFAWPVRRSAALLFVPYFLWVSFAAALNFEVWRLNS